MKHKHPKNYLKLGILLFYIMALLVNCQHNDTEDVPIQQQSKYRIQTLGTDQISKNEQLTNKLKNLLNIKDKVSNNNSREIYNSDYGFTINTDLVKYLENTENGYHSYSFPITRDSTTHDKVENLLLSLNPDGTYGSFILKYDFTKEEFTNITQSTLDSRTTIYTPIDFDTSVFYDDELAKLATHVCVETWVWTYLGETEECDNCDTAVYGYVLESNDCTYTGSGSSGASDAGTGSNGDGSSSGGSNDGTDQTEEDIYLNDGHGELASVPAVDQEGINDQNCYKLNNLTEKPIANQTEPTKVKTLLNELKTNSTTLNKEMGYFLTPETIEELIFVPSYFDGEDGEDEVLLDLGTNAVSVLMHIHYNNETENKKQLCVPSLTDLYQIYRAIGTGNIFSPSTFTFFVVTEHGTKYALQINDTNAFLNSNFSMLFFTNWDNDLVKNKGEDIFGMSENGKVGYKILPNNSNTQNELQFAKFLEGENLGLNLFRANEDFSEWTKIEYKNGTYTETPCN